MTKPLLTLCATLTLAALPAFASMQCNLTGVPLQVSAEGLAEPVGDILLQCGGGPPNGVLTGSFRIFLNTKVANSPAEDGTYTGITLAQEFPGSIFFNQPATIRPLETSILVENFSIPLSAQGFFSIKFGGIRAEALTTTQAFLQFSGNQQLVLTAFNQVVTVALAQTTLLATHIPATASGLGPVLPSQPDFNTMILARLPMATTRITEGWANAFVPRKGVNSNGTRILIRLSGVPEGARIFAPDAIAGTGAFQPTLSGAMGGYPASGLYAFSTTGTLLLSRVRNSAPDGSGGFPGYYPNFTGAQSLAAVAEADSSGGTQFLVYETMDANPAQRESAQIPIWILLPNDRFVAPSVVRQTLSLAPLSSEPGSVAGAPVPRYRAVAVGPDCVLLGDCAEPYFPWLSVTPPTSSEFSAPTGGSSIDSYFLIHNTGAGLLEWRTAIRYRGPATGWLTVSPTSGVNNRTVRFDLHPASLAPGRYEAEIVVQQIGSATGANAETIIPIVFNVTAALPPPIPLPTITAVLDAANRWPAPAAPGGLAILTGVNFGANTTLTAGGKAARILQRTATEMLVELPLDLPSGRTTLLPFNSDRPGTGASIDIVPVAPSTLFVLNAGDDPNSETRPAEAGQRIQCFVTGTRGASQPLSLKIHDRYLWADSVPTDQPGVEVITFIVPDDLPTTPSAVYYCALPAAGGDGACSHPKDIWIKAATR